MPIHVSRVEEVAAHVEGLMHGANRFDVVRRTVRVAVTIAADRPCTESNFTHGHLRPAQQSPLHASSSARAEGVVTGSEQAVPTHTIALGASVMQRTMTFRGR